jgi:hypothetical protein
VAKAQFYKHQKVWVQAVGAWAVIEKIIPVWTKGFDEPVKITYDVGLGRDFRADELRADDATESLLTPSGSTWRLMRARNKWQDPEECAHHPFPGTFPVVVTDANDWGGWRTPGAEYDRDPHKIEWQARLIANAPVLLKLAQELSASVAEAPEDATPELLRLAKAAIRPWLWRRRVGRLKSKRCAQTQPNQSGSPTTSPQPI